MHAPNRGSDFGQRHAIPPIHSPREGSHAAGPIQVTAIVRGFTRNPIHAPNRGSDFGRRHAIPPVIPHGWARMVRAPFKSRPSCGDSDAIPSTRRTADLISDGDTPSLPRVEAGGVAERAWGLSDARPAGTESGRGLPHSTTLRDLCERRRAAHRFLIGRIDAIVRGSFAP